MHKSQIINEVQKIMFPKSGIYLYQVCRLGLKLCVVTFVNLNKYITKKSQIVNLIYSINLSLFYGQAEKDFC